MSQVDQSPKLPCYWHAQYAEGTQRVSPLLCPSCSNKWRTDINKCACGSTVSMASPVSIDLKSQMIFEFDENGQEICKWNELPREDMIFFGMINTYKNEVYGINLNNGQFIIRNLNSQHSMTLGQCIPRSYGNIDGSRSCYSKIDTEEYDYRSNLHYAKTASSSISGQSMALEFTMGYIFMDKLIAVVVDTRDFIPRFGTKHLDHPDQPMSIS